MVLDLLLQEKILLVQGTAFNWPEPDHVRIVTCLGPTSWEMPWTVSRASCRAIVSEIRKQSLLNAMGNKMRIGLETDPHKTYLS